MKGVLNVHDILKLLPHRYPFLLIDKVIDITLGKSLVALKNVCINEPFFVGHFPGQPVMPGVLILEAMAQAAGILAYQSTYTTADDNILYFAGVDKARFRRVVEPGDQLRIQVNVLRTKEKFWKLEGFAYVEDELACSAEFLCARK